MDVLDALYDDLPALNSRAITLRAEIVERQEELDEINSRVRDQVQGTGTVELPNGGRVSVQGNHRFNAARFTALYPPEQRPELYELVPNRKAVAEALTEDEYAACGTPSTRRVVWS